MRCGTETVSLVPAYHEPLLYLKTAASFAGCARNNCTCPINGVEYGASCGLDSSPRSRCKALIVLNTNKHSIGIHNALERSERRRLSIAAEKIKADIAV